MKDKLKNETFLGVVVDNQDPKKQGRCKVKVFQVFDKLETKDIPWATPWKDLNGNEFTIPEIGKFVSVVFDQGNKYTPEYIWAQNFNINLENKLSKLSGEDYTSMRAVLFDHSTQIYRNQTEGLKIDHEYTNINLDRFGNILLNLRDNKSVITLGSKDADESAMIGSAFISWFDTLVTALLGGDGGAYLDASGSAVLASPGLSQVLMQYNSIKDTFVSKHVRICGNDEIIAQNREYINQRGDSDYASRYAATPAPVSVVTSGETENVYQSKDADGEENPANKSVFTPSDEGADGEAGEGDGNPTALVTSDINLVGKAKYTESAMVQGFIRKGYRNGGIPESEMRKISNFGSPTKDGNSKLAIEAAIQYQAMEEAAKKDGIKWTVSSTYRTLGAQKALNPGGNTKGVAKAGGSPHGWGGAIDIRELFRHAQKICCYKQTRCLCHKSNNIVRQTNPIYLWLLQNGPRFGWFPPYRMRVPAADGSWDECWHFEYWGPIAK